MHGCYGSDYGNVGLSKMVAEWMMVDFGFVGSEFMKNL